MTRRDVELARDDDVALVIDDATQSDAKCSEAQRGPLRAVVEAVVVVAMECGLHAQRAGQRIDRMEPVRMTAGRLVGDQKVGALGGEPREHVRVDRTPVSSSRSRTHRSCRGVQVACIWAPS